MFKIQLQNSLVNDLAARVVSCDFHPARPWVVTAHESGHVRIWDYDVGKVVHTFSPLHIEQNEKDMYNLLSILEKDMSYKGPRKLDNKGVEKKKYGNIKFVKFVDQDVRFFKYHQDVCIKISYLI